MKNIALHSVNKLTYDIFMSRKAGRDLDLTLATSEIVVVIYKYSF